MSSIKDMMVFEVQKILPEDLSHCVWGIDEEPEVLMLTSAQKFSPPCEWAFLFLRQHQFFGRMQSLVELCSRHHIDFLIRNTEICLKYDSEEMFRKDMHEIGMSDIYCKETKIEIVVFIILYRKKFFLSLPLTYCNPCSR